MSPLRISFVPMEFTEVLYVLSPSTKTEVHCVLVYRFFASLLLLLIYLLLLLIGIIPIHDVKSVIIESDDRVNVRDKDAMENVMA